MLAIVAVARRDGLSLVRIANSRSPRLVCRYRDVIEGGSADRTRPAIDQMSQQDATGATYQANMHHLQDRCEPDPVAFGIIDDRELSDFVGRVGEAREFPAMAIKPLIRLVI